MPVPGLRLFVDACVTTNLVVAKDQDRVASHGFLQLGMKITTCTPSLICRAYPGFAFRCVHTRPQNSRTNAFVGQDLLQSGSNIVLLGVDGKHLAPAAFGQFLLDFLDQFSFFRIKLFFGKVARLGNDECNIALELLIELLAIQSP